MPRVPQRAGVVVLALLVLAVGAAPASAQKLRQPSAGSALAQLVRQTNALPSSAATKKQKAKLKKAAGVARRSARKSPCTSVRQLATFRRVLRGIKVKKGRRNRRGNNRLRALGPASLAASRALIAGPRTKRCGGGTKPSKLEDVRTTITQSDANGMRLRVDLPALRFVDADGGGRTWTKLALPETDTPAQPGSPGIPVVSKVLGVPEGATMKVDATNSTSYTLDGVDVFPAQREPMDQGAPFDQPPYSTPPFLVDSGEYRQRGNVPAAPAGGGILGQSRDVTLGSLEIPAAQYNPAAKRLKVLTSVDVQVSFEGGSHQFSPSSSRPGKGPSGACAAPCSTPRPFAACSRRASSAAARRCSSSRIRRRSRRPTPSPAPSARRACARRSSRPARTPAAIGTTAAEIQT